MSAAVIMFWKGQTRMLEGVKEIVKSKLAEMQAQATLAWKQLVIECVDGAVEGSRELDPDAVAIQLEQLGKSVEELEEATATYVERKRLVQVIADAEGALPKIAALRQEIGDKVREFEATTKQHETEVRQLESQISRLRNKMSDATAGKRTLLNLASPETQAKYRNLESQIESRVKENEKLDTALCNEKARLNAAKSEAERVGQTEQAIENIAIAERLLAKAQADVDSARAETEQLIAAKRELLETEALAADNFVSTPVTQAGGLCDGQFIQGAQPAALAR